MIQPTYEFGIREAHFSLCNPKALIRCIFALDGVFGRHQNDIGIQVVEK
jgi:hypothetical protein